MSPFCSSIVSRASLCWACKELKWSEGGREGGRRRGEEGEGGGGGGREEGGGGREGGRTSFSLCMFA